MKANEAPEKIYLQVCGDCPQTDCESCKFEDFEDNITWCKDRIFPKDIEYTRTDAFMKKADEFIGSFFHPDDTEFRNCILKKFHKYMKGE